jgi:hypothetical protein
MKTVMLGLFLSTLIAPSSYAQQSPAPPTETIKTAASQTPEQQEVINLSNMKWNWMAGKKVDSLETLFDDKAMFTHMGGTWGKTQELAPLRAVASGTKKLWFTQLTLAYLVTQPSCWRTLICRQQSVTTKSPILLW